MVTSAKELSCYAVGKDVNMGVTKTLRLVACRSTFQGAGAVERM